MKGDFTRWTFDPKNQFTRVLQQQGRVQLDADWNEQTAILLHSLRTLAEDLIGPFGAPPNPDGTPGNGFRLAQQIGANGKVVPNVYRLQKGRYYVGGLLVENPGDLASSPGGPLPNLGQGKHLLYLDVWERLVTYVENDLIREVALGGVDTAARAQVAWRVRAVSGLGDDVTCLKIRNGWTNRVSKWQPENRGRLKAQAQRKDPTSDDPCIVSPEARYTGENQLYRVEIHRGGTAAEGATFKWSRENGSVIFPVLSVTDQTVALEHLGRDGRFDLEEGDWVELLDDDTDFLDDMSPLLKVRSVDRDRSRVILEGTLPARKADKHRFLRRWDQRERKEGTFQNGAVPVQEGQWVELEHGIHIRFDEAPTGQPAHSYRSGDSWLIPARTATGDVEWPGPFDNPDALPPHVVEHRYAPLGLVTIDGDQMTFEDCRRTFGTRALVLDTGVADWTLVRGPGTPLPRPAALVEDPNVGWSQALLPARWISALPSSAAPSGTSLFELRFQLGPSFRSAMLSLRLFADNSAVVRLNNKEIGRHERPDDRGFTGEPGLVEAEGPAFFREGENTLVVEVTNADTVLDGGGGGGVFNTAASRIFIPLGDSPMGFVLAGRVERDCGCD
jgi:hypothetical protein